MGLWLLPLRVVGQSLRGVLSSQRVGEDVFGEGSLRAEFLVSGIQSGLRRLGGFLCCSGVCTEGRLVRGKVDAGIYDLKRPNSAPFFPPNINLLYLLFL